MKFDDYIAHKGSGDRDLAVVGFGGTILMKKNGDGLLKPDPAVLKYQVRMGIERLGDEALERLGKVTVLRADPLIDSADAGMTTIAEAVNALRMVQRSVKPHAILGLFGTDSFKQLGAAAFQGLPKGSEIPVVLTCSMKAVLRGLTDAMLSVRNAMEVCMHDVMHEGGLGKLASVVNAGSSVYPPGFLHKENTAYSAFRSRVNRIMMRTRQFNVLVEKSQGTPEKRFPFVEENMWDPEDEWKLERPSRPCDFPQGDATENVKMLGGFKDIRLSPAYDYKSLYDEVKIALEEADLHPSERRLNALVCTVIGSGNIRSDFESKEIVKNVSRELAALGVPMVIQSETWSKQPLPATEPPRAEFLYAGHPSLIAEDAINMNGLAIGESEILLGRALAEAHRMGLKGTAIVTHVKKFVQAYMTEWK